MEEPIGVFVRTAYMIQKTIASDREGESGTERYHFEQ